MKREFDGRQSPGRFALESQSPSSAAYGPSPIPNLTQWPPSTHQPNTPQNQLPPPVQPSDTTPPDHTMSQTAANGGLRAHPYSYQMPPHQFLPPGARFGPQGTPPYGYKQGGALPQLSFVGTAGQQQQQQPQQQQQQQQVPPPATGINMPSAPNTAGQVHMPGEVLTQAPAPSNDYGSERSRARVNKACDRCRAHKIKCSGKFPCSHCTKHGSECKFRSSVTTDDGPKSEQSLGYAYANGEAPDAASAGEPRNGVASAPKRMKTSPAEDAGNDSRRDPDPGAADPRNIPNGVAPGPHAPCQSDASYISYLENRVRYLEAVLAKAPLNEPSAPVAKSAYKLDDVVQIQAPHSTKWRLCARYQGALAVKLCASLYEDLSPEAKAQVEVPRLNYFGFNMSGCNYLKPPELPAVPDVNVLTTEQRLEYVDFFLREINPLFAVVHERIFREQFQVFLGILTDSRLTNQTSLFAAMACLVTALAIRFTEFAKPAGPCMQMLEHEERLFNYAHQVISTFSFEWESFELIQCWLLAALYLRVTHRQTSCHSALGHASTMCRSMGIGKYERVFSTASAYEQTKARRIFFAVYTFDRVLGLQGGKLPAVGEFEVGRELPPLDYEKERGSCDWLTRPAFAMLHIARLANYLKITHSNEYDHVSAEKLKRDFDEFRGWMDANGFSDARDIYEPGGHMQDISSGVKVQVKCHFYDLVHAIHGRSLFSFFGHRVSIEGFQFRTILECNADSVYLLQKLAASSTLYAPWYLTLQLLLTVGINSLVFIKGGVHVAKSRQLIKETMQLIQVLRNSPVYNEKGKKIFKRRFKMAEECHWLLKMMSHIMSLHHEESVANLRELGIDHGSSEVNQSSLKFDNTQNVSNSEGRLGSLMSAADSRPPKSNAFFSQVFSESTSETTYEDSLSQPDGLQYPIDRYLDNLAWFDQWLDFNHEA